MFYPKCDRAYITSKVLSKSLRWSEALEKGLRWKDWCSYKQWKHGTHGSPQPRPRPHPAATCVLSLLEERLCEHTGRSHPQPENRVSPLPFTHSWQHPSQPQDGKGSLFFKYRAQAFCCGGLRRYHFNVHAYNCTALRGSEKPHLSVVLETCVEAVCLPDQETLMQCFTPKMQTVPDFHVH